MATLFPRGKDQVGPSSGPKKRKRKDDSNDGLFIERTQAAQQNDRKNTRKRKSGDDDDGNLKEFNQGEVRELLDEHRSLKVEFFHKSTAQEGMLLFGCVREIRGLSLAISIPHGITGYVQANQVSEEYTAQIKSHLNGDTDELTSLNEMFHIGDLVVCSVMRRTDARHIQLTMYPGVVNKYLSANDLFVGKTITGAVKSEEDHGYTINIGCTGINAFLPMKECGERHFKIGSVIRAVISTIRGGGKIIILSIDSKKIQNSFIKATQNASLDAIQPGSIGFFKPTVKDENVGMIGKFLGFNASITLLDYDMDNAKSDEDVSKEGFSKKRKAGKKGITASFENQKGFKCCVLYVNPLTKHIVLCSNTVVLDASARHKFITKKLPDIPSGMKCTVELQQTIHGLGAVFQMDCGVKGFSLLKNLSDDKFVDFTQTFGGDKTFEARVIQNMTVDGVVGVTLKRSMVENEFYSYDTILPGSLIDCIISAIKENGLLVRIGSTKSSPIRGFIGKNHLADIILQHPERVFSVGDQIKCRVLEINEEQERLQLTHKKTLVKSKLPIVTGYDQLKDNMIVHGYITSIQDFGVYVNLYNGVYGFVPKYELAVEFSDDPKKAFYVGQVVKCRIVFCRADEEKARFSLILKPRELHIGSRSRQKEDVESLEVTEKTDDGLLVVSTKSKRKGFLPKMHLSDFPSLSEGWYNFISEGDIVDSCLFVNAKENIFTKKRSIVNCRINPTANCKNLGFNDLKEDMLTIGFIHRHEEFGVFVQLPGGTIGLCPKSKMADRYLLNSKGCFADGQTVVAKVVEIDEEKKRFVLSLKESDCVNFECGLDIDAYASEFSDILKLSNPNWSQGLGIGEVCKVAISQTATEDGYPCLNEGLADGFKSFVIDDIKDSDAVKDQMVNAVILHVDLSAKKIFLSAMTSLYASKKKYKSGSVLPWTVKFVNDDVSTLISESNARHTVAVAMVRSSPVQSFLQQSRDALKIGDMFNAPIISSNCGSVVVDVSGKTKESSMKLRERSESEASDSHIHSSAYFGNLKVGQNVKGVIKSLKSTHLLVRISDSDTDGGFRGQSITGRLHYSELNDGSLEGHFSMEERACWSDISAKVIGFRDVKTHRFLAITRRNLTRCVVELSQRERSLNMNLGRLNAGDEVTAFFHKYEKEKSEMHVEITPAVRGCIPFLLLSDYPVDRLKKTINCSKPYATCCFVRKVFSNSVLLAAKGALIDRNTRKDVKVVDEGCITNGIVRRIRENNAVVMLPDGVIGTVHATDASDDYSEDVFNDLYFEKVIRCCVLKCIDRKNANLSMRESHLLPEGSTTEIRDPSFNSGKEMTVGMILRGYISSFTKAGLFIELGRTCTGRADLSNVSKYFINDLSLVENIFQAGTLVTCKVLSITEIEGKVAVSILESDTGLPDMVPGSLGLPLRTGEKVVRKTHVKHLLDRVEGRKGRIKKNNANSGMGKEASLKNVPLMSKVVINHEIIEDDDPGFSWEPTETPAPAALSDEEEEEEEQVAPPAKKTKLEKKMEEKQREDDIREQENRLLENNSPQTAAEWNKLVVSSPQNSLIWISYMTFYLKDKKIELARAVAERALKTIDFTEEKERWNVWAALINLENKFGKEDTLTDAIKRACQHNDPLKVNLHMVSVYERSGKFEEAEDVCQKMTKKFRQNKTVWMLYITHLMQRSLRDRANEIFKRSLQSLEKNIHLEVISKFAQLEYKCGDSEHGRVLFENALASYPRRADIWSIYIDMLIKNNLNSDARDVLERVTTMNFSSKNMKSFFKKYLEFEGKVGNEKLVAQVKQKALDYVRSKTSGMED